MKVERQGSRSVAVFLLGLVVLNPPLLLVFSRGEAVLGIPLLYFFLFVAWATLIALIALTVGAEARGGGSEGARADPEAEG